VKLKEIKRSANQMHVEIEVSELRRKLFWIVCKAAKIGCTSKQIEFQKKYVLKRNLEDSL